MNQLHNITSTLCYYYTDLQQLFEILFWIYCNSGKEHQAMGHTYSILAAAFSVFLCYSTLCIHNIYNIPHLDHLAFGLKHKLVLDFKNPKNSYSCA